MEETKEYKIKGQDYFVDGKLVNTRVIIDKLNGFGNIHHSVTYLNRDGSINNRLKRCPLNVERFLI